MLYCQDDHTQVCYGMIVHISQDCSYASYGSRSKTHARLLVSEWHLHIWMYVFAAVAKDRERFAKGLNTTIYHRPRTCRIRWGTDPWWRTRRSACRSICQRPLGLVAWSKASWCRRRRKNLVLKFMICHDLSIFFIFFPFNMVEFYSKKGRQPLKKSGFFRISDPKSWVLLKDLEVIFIFPQ